MAKTSFNEVIPSKTLKDSIRVGKAMVDSNAGKTTDKLTLAQLMDLSPTSSTFIQLLSSSQMYGLTEGSAFSGQISLTDLGKDYFYPRSSDEENKALFKAANFPPLLKKIYDHFNNNKLPPFENAKNILLRNFSIKEDKLKHAWNIIRENAKLVGFLQVINSVEWINLSKISPTSLKKENDENDEDIKENEESEEFSDENEEKSIEEQNKSSDKNNKVFISHGKNKEIVTQLKDLITFGKLVPVIAEEHETTSKPVPEKVLEDMKSCFAGIIHIEAEEQMLDNEGKSHPKLNENVLIEIGASMALYNQNLILLVKKGIQLPSNLQGLYLCYYDGDKLDYESTMKLLKTLNEFK